MSWTDLHPFIQEALRTTLAVGVLVLLVLVIRKPFARRFGAKAAYMLWALPLIRFVMPPLPSSWALSGWLGFGQNVPQPAVTVPAEPFWVQVPSGFDAVVAPPPPIISSPVGSASVFENALAHAPLILTLVWLTGAIVWLGRSFHQQRTFLELIRYDSEPASDSLQSETRAIAAQLKMKRVPDVRASLLCSGPLVTGIINPVVLLPLWFQEDYTREEQRDALLHELMHLKRRDLWSFQAARIVAATQWFNPFAHLALSAFRTDQESACDADVLAQDRISPAAYGRTLVKAARLARPSDRRIAAASLTLAHPIKERLIMMQHPKPTLRSRLTGTALASAIGIAAIFTTASCMSAQADKQETNTFVFKSDGLSDDQHIVLFSDPMANVHPHLEKLDDMDFSGFNFTMDLDIDADEMELNALMSELHELHGLEELKILGELGDIMSFESEDGTNVFVMKSGEDEEAFEMRIEKWAEQFEDRAEKWSEEMEARSEEIERRAEAIAIRIETKAEAWAEQHEARAEEMAAKIEAQFGEEFETEIEAAAEVYEELADQCEDRGEDNPNPEIVSATNEQTGEVHKALCLNGDRDRLKSSELMDWVDARSDLTDEEKEHFKRHHDSTIHIEVHREHHVHRSDSEDELDGAED